MALSQRSRTVLTLYSARDCIHSHRVRLVLSAKGVVHDLVLVDLNDPPEDLLDLNPYNTVPTLVDRDLVLYDTNVICEYLDERYPHPPLMPIDPLTRARMRLAMVRVENDWLTLAESILADDKDSDAARRQLRDELIRNVPTFDASPYFLSPDLSLADCVIMPLLWRLQALDVRLPRNAKPITEYAERMFLTPEFVRSLTDDESQLRG